MSRERINVGEGRETLGEWRRFGVVVDGGLRLWRVCE